MSAKYNPSLEKWGYIPDGEQSEILGICLQIEHLRNDIKFYENRISELEGLYA